jgi:dihydroneopterin aldolase
MTALDGIAVTGLMVDCVVGIYAEERTRTQPVALDVHLELDLTRAAAEAAVSATIDYAVLGAELAFILRAGRFQLLESAALALVTHALSCPRGPGAPRVERARVALAKPEILAGLFPGATPPKPTVTIARRQGEIASPRRVAAFAGGAGRDATEVFACPDAAVLYAPAAPGREAGAVETLALPAGGVLVVERRR